MGSCFRCASTLTGACPALGSSMPGFLSRRKKGEPGLNLFAGGGSGSWGMIRRRRAAPWIRLTHREGLISFIKKDGQHRSLALQLFTSSPRSCGSQTAGAHRWRHCASWRISGNARLKYLIYYLVLVLFTFLFGLYCILYVYIVTLYHWHCFFISVL